MSINWDEYDAEVEDLKAEVRATRRYNNELLRHPDCRDPDHPGCEDCEESEDEDD